MYICYFLDRRQDCNNQSPTNYSPQSRMMVDLGSTRTLQVQHYCLKHHKNISVMHFEVGILRDPMIYTHWNLLKEHNYDVSMADTKFSKAHW